MNKQKEQEPRVWCVDKSLWENDFNTLSRKFFVGQLNRFKYDFYLLKRITATKEEFLEYCKIQEFDINGEQAKIAKKGLDEKAREKNFNKFLNDIKQTNNFSEVLILLSSYSEIFII